MAAPLNLSLQAPQDPAVEQEPAARQEDAALRQRGMSALPVVSALAVAANENDAQAAALRLATRALAREKALERQRLAQRAERRRWLMLLVFVLLVAASLQVFAERVVRVLPGMAQVYAALGMPVQPPGWQVDSMHVRWVRSADGVPELLLHGQVRNDSGRALPMPQLALALLDDGGAVLYRWRIPVRRVQMVPAGAEARFRTRLADVPVQAASVRLHVLPPMQPSLP